MTWATCCWRAAMKRKVWVSAVGAGPSASNSVRMAVPSAVPSGSLVDTTSCPRA